MENCEPLIKKASVQDDTYLSVQLSVLYGTQTYRTRSESHCDTII